MNVLGRMICTLLGWLMGGFLGAIVGFFIGGFFDRAFSQFSRQHNPDVREKVERALFDTVFPLLGKLAKSDGRISEEEIGATEQLMTNMRLSSDQRQRAIELFKQGSEDTFDIRPIINDFISTCGAYPDIKQMLLVYLLSLAMADGELAAGEDTLLRQVGRQLGYPEAVFDHILKMAKAQHQFHEQGGSADASPGRLANAYDALGVNSSVSDTELKKHYRKLMSQYHPDKLMGQGVPDEMIKVATEKSQEIQTAYDLIKKQRAAS